MRNGYWKNYYHTVKKHRIKLAQPVKNCLSCGEPIINPKKYKQSVCLSGIKGIRSECKKQQDREYKRALPKSKKKRKRDEWKKPEGINDKYNVEKVRKCLKCNETFTSKSLCNRICEKCKLLQPDIMNFSSMALETHNIEELLESSLFMRNSYDM